MISTAQELSPAAIDSIPELGDPRLQALRIKINSEEYLREAIHRIALILSNELLDIPQGGMSYERQRKKRR